MKLIKISSHGHHSIPPYEHSIHPSSLEIEIYWMSKKIMSAPVPQSRYETYVEARESIMRTVCER